MVQKYGTDQVAYHPGVPIFNKIPSAPISTMKTKSRGAPGVDCYWYNGTEFGENLVHYEVLEATRTLVIEPRIKQLRSDRCSRMEFVLTPTSTGKHTFGVTACGATVLRVDEREILHHPGFIDVKVEYIMQPGDFEVRAQIEMAAGREYHVVIDTVATTAPCPSSVFTMAPQAAQVGFYENLLGASAFAEIEALASSHDASVVFTANNREFESESFDRSSMSLSALQNDLVSTVAAASPKTVVVNQTGAPISIPWLGKVEGVLQCWFAGQEVGNALAELLSGDTNPCGKLPVTFPERIEHSPSHGNFPTDANLEVCYAEGLEMGYRARSCPSALFPFGHGLSYTTFEFMDFALRGDGPCDVTITVSLRNTGRVVGQEVVQIYVDGVLKAFKKTSLAPGETQKVKVSLDKYAFSRWDIESHAWVAGADGYEVSVSRDARTPELTKTYQLRRGLTWRGL